MIPHERNPRKTRFFSILEKLAFLQGLSCAQKVSFGSGVEDGGWGFGVKVGYDSLDYIFFPSRSAHSGGRGFSKGSLKYSWVLYNYPNELPNSDRRVDNIRQYCQKISRSQMKRGFLGNQIFDRLLDGLSNATGFEILR